MIRDVTSTALNVSSARAMPVTAGGGTRPGVVHGPIVWTKTTRPAKAPTLSRRGVEPSSGSVPVQAARVSVATSGVHSGVAGVKRSRGQPTASNTGCQFISAWTGGASAVRCGGTAWKSSSVPVVATPT